MVRLLVFCILFVVAHSSSYAQNAWYVGKVSRIALVNNGFVLTFKNNALSDCKYKYAYFTNNSLSDVQLKNAYTIALTSITTGLEMGIVINKSLNGNNGICNATGMVADLRAN